MSVSFMERCNGNVESVNHQVTSFHQVTSVSTLRDDLTFIVSVSLRKYDIFS